MLQGVTDGGPEDTDLVRAAQSGDAGGLGLLLARHRAGMYAVALARLGHGHDAEDAVQEAALIALRRIGDVRDPQAVGPWLRSVVRNACRMRLRKKTPIPMATVERRPDPAATLEENALRDWVWGAVETLSPGLRLVTMLRYFTDVTSYEEIAALCEVPVGTVRSRLSQARAKLSDALLATEAPACGDVTALTTARRHQAEETMRRGERGQLGAALADDWSPRLDVTWPTGKRTGRDYLVRSFDRDMGDGVRQQLMNVVAGRDVVIWEVRLVNPPHDPFHCPREVLWVHFLEKGKVSRLRLYHPKNPR